MMPPAASQQTGRTAAAGPNMAGSVAATCHNNVTA